MNFQGDPYRTLGIAPGASLNEIRSAYRRLVKQYHPDAAGERALPRFLAIQAAYERLVDGEGRLRRAVDAGRATRRRPVARRSAARRASRDAWRARRSAERRPAGRDGTSRRDRAGDAKRRTGAGAGPTAGARADGRRAPRAGERPRRGDPARASRAGVALEGHARVHDLRRGRRDPARPGVGRRRLVRHSTGTYWTINPREYADPRKHGPEYQARARARGGGRRPAGRAGGPARTRDDPASTRRPRPPTPRRAGRHWSTDGRGRTRRPAGRRRAAIRVGAAQLALRRRAPGTATRAPGVPRQDAQPATPIDAAALPDLETLAAGGAARPARASRGASAVAARARAGRLAADRLCHRRPWSPRRPGCASFARRAPTRSSAGRCWRVQPLVVAALFALPRLAAIAAFAALVALAVAVPCRLHALGRRRGPAPAAAPTCSRRGRRAPTSSPSPGPPSPCGGAARAGPTGGASPGP